MIGSRFVELTPRKNFLHLPSEVELDITNAKEVKDIISSYKFSAVIHFAAFTDVGGAEKERGDKNGVCWQVNVEGTKNLVDAINPNVTHFIHISTDMVFSGSSEDPGPYDEEQKPEAYPDKLTWYGWTKAEGERYVSEKLGNNASIVRLIYPVRASFEGKLDYLRRPLQLFDEGKLYPLFSDQQVSVSFIDEIATALEKIIDDNHRGVFHISSRDTTTPHEIVSYMLLKTRGLEKAIDSTTLGEFLKKTGQTVVRYPKYGGLSVNRTEEKLGLRFSSWREIVDKMVAQGLGKK